MEQKFKVGDSVKSLNGHGEGTIRRFCSGHPFPYEVVYENGVIYFCKERALEKVENFPNLKKKIKESKELIGKWIPKKGELIDVRRNKDSKWSKRKFRVYMDGKYWCEHIAGESLVGWEFTRPIEKEKSMTDMFKELCETEFELGIKPTPRQPEPKFKVGDRVQYTSANMVTLSNKKLTRKLTRYDIGIIKDVTKKPDIWYVEFENGSFYVEEKNLIILIGENKMEDLTSLKRKYAALGKEIKKIEKLKNEDYVLKLEVDGYYDNLEMLFRIDLVEYHLGWVTNDGRCNILSNEEYIQNYEKWRENGMKVCSDKIEWWGKRYYISNMGTLTS